MSLYQSVLRKYISKDIYKKSLFEVEILGEKYRGVVKMKKKFGQAFRRYMVQGASFGNQKTLSLDLQKDFEHIRRDFSVRGSLFFQVGCEDVIARHATERLKKEKAVVEDVLKKRQYLTSDLWQWYSLKPSVKEHMPNATILIDLEKSNKELQKDLSSSGKRYISKGRKNGLVLEQASNQVDREMFRDVRYSMAFDKGFSIVPKDQFLDLMTYLTETKQGVLMTAYLGGDIVTGMVCVNIGKQLVYLYGATNRAFGNIGAQYWLTWEVIQRAKSQGYASFDLLGVAPTGYDDHALSGVTRYKQAFGGKTIDYVGNYDLILSSPLYSVWKFLKG